jgi:hypothetical protein
VEWRQAYFVILRVLPVEQPMRVPQRGTARPLRKRGLLRSDRGKPRMKIIR